MKRICIVGSGAAGILLLLSFQQAKVDPKQITIIDPFHDGGDLQRKWSHVKSNTLWKQALEAVQPPQNPPPEPWCSLDPESPCELRYLISYLWYCVKSYFRQCSIHTGTVESVEQDNTTNVWTVKIKGATAPIEAHLLFLTTGAEPKSLDLPFPSIPLSIALDPTKLREQVKEDDHVILFGTAHSATLIVENLAYCGAKVTNFYATPEPFYYARDGAYDGIKQDAAEIADRILANKIPNLTLVSIHDVAAVIRHTQHVDYAIYAMGFQANNQLGLRNYDGETGRLNGVTNAWGFGIAYPNRAPDGVHWDVSVPAFMTHIQKQMPNILSLLGTE